MESSPWGRMLGHAHNQVNEPASWTFIDGFSFNDFYSQFIPGAKG
jgi:hypothetical protein